MSYPLTRRALLKTVAAAGTLAVVPSPAGLALPGHKPDCPPGWVCGELTGAQALVLALQREGVECVFGIPGAQSNELWDTFKTLGLSYLLVTHEFSASTMADGYARATGR